MSDQQVSTAPLVEPSQQLATPSSDFKVPESYADRGWVKEGKIKSADDLFKAYDNAQTMLGKRPAGIPQNDAPDEEWNKFFEAARPEKPEAYTLSDVEGVPEGLDLKPYKDMAAKLAFEAGLTPKQADKLFNLYIKTEMEAAGKDKETITTKQKDLDAEFDKITKEHFGDKFDEVQKISLDMVNQYVPENLRAAYGELADNPKALAAFAAAMKGAHDEIAKVKAEYGAEGSITSGTQSAGASIDEVRKELATLRTSKEGSDFLHPEHEKTMERINELSQIVDKHYKSK